MPAAEVEAVRGHEGGGVEQHVPARACAPADPLQRVLDAGEVGLRGESEEVVAPGGRLRGRGRARLVHPQVRRHHRQVDGAGAVCAIELADAVHGVVVVEGEQELVSGRERVGLADQLQRVAGVGREHHRVLVGVGAEEVEDAAPASLHEPRAADGGRVRGVGVAEDVPSSSSACRRTCDAA